jgi:hypothetical protein
MHERIEEEEVGRVLSKARSELRETPALIEFCGAVLEE